MHRQSRRSVFASVSRCLSVSPDVRLRVESFGGIAFDKLTGTLIELDRDAMRMLCYINESEIVAEHTVISHFADQDSSVVVGKLLELGILRISSYTEKDSHCLPESIQWPLESYMTAPETVHWAITYRCDQQCLDCYARRYNSSVAGELNTADAIKLVDKLAEWGVFQLAIGGGEPFLRPDLARICRHARQKGLVVHLTTGHHSVNSNLLKSFEGSISVLQIGLKHEKLLASLAEETGKLHNTLQNACDFGIHTGVNLMLSNTVLAHFDELIECLVQVGVDRITLLRYKPPADHSRWIAENPSSDVWYDFEQKLRDMLSRYTGVSFRVDCALSFLQRGLRPETAASLGIKGCVAGERILALAPDGSVYPCSQLIGSHLQAGNLLVDDPKDLWAYSNELIMCRTFRDSEEFGKSGCGACGTKYSCGGCRIFSDSLRGGDPGCPLLIQRKDISE